MLKSRTGEGPNRGWEQVHPGLELNLSIAVRSISAGSGKRNLFQGAKG